MKFLSNELQCLFRSDLTYAFKGAKLNETSIQCQIYPVDTYLKISGDLLVQDATYNVSTVNSVRLTIVRDKILIANVYPSLNVHLIPG